MEQEQNSQGQQAWPIESIGPKQDNMGKNAGLYPVKMAGIAYTLYLTESELAAAGITPPPDPIDFDALPVGTVLRFNSSGTTVVKLPGKGWWNIDYGNSADPRESKLWTVVHSPSAPSVRDALHAIGLTDQDIDGISDISASWLAMKVRAAVREAEQGR